MEEILMDIPLISRGFRRQEVKTEPLEPSFDEQIEKEAGFKLATQQPAENEVDLYDKLLSRNKDMHPFTQYILESRSTTFYEKDIAELLRSRDRHTDKIMAILHDLSDTRNLGVEAFVNEDDIMGRRAENMDFLKWLFTRRGIAEQNKSQGEMKQFIRRD
jgi:hypothetical protein